MLASSPKSQVFLLRCRREPHRVHSLRAKSHRIRVGRGDLVRSSGEESDLVPGNQENLEGSRGENIYRLLYSVAHHVVHTAAGA